MGLYILSVVILLSLMPLRAFADHGAHHRAGGSSPYLAGSKHTDAVRGTRKIDMFPAERLYNHEVISLRDLDANGEYSVSWNFVDQAWLKRPPRFDLGNFCLVTKLQNRRWQFGAELVALQQLLPANNRAGIDLMYTPGLLGVREGVLTLQLKMKTF